jgi:2'-deoxynucleoside 5'-phosphate N-hydrolase
MNIYFSCSVTGGRSDEEVYQLLVNELLKQGHEVPTAHLSNPDVMKLEYVVDPKEIYTRDMQWLEDCDAVVAEVSTPSHGVGYEIAAALNLGKPVLCCFRRGKVVSKIITGNSSKTLTVREYTTNEEAIQGLKDFLASIRTNQDC